VAPSLRAARLRLGAYYLEQLIEGQLDLAAARVRFEHDRPQLETVQAWAASSAGDEAAAMLCVNFAVAAPSTLAMWLDVDQYIRWLQQALDLGDVGADPRAWQLGALVQLGRGLTGLSDYAGAMEALERAETLAASDAEQAAVLSAICFALAKAGDVRAAIATAERALALVPPDDAVQLAGARADLGGAYADAGDHARGVEYMEQALAAAEAHHQRGIASQLHLRLADSYLALGRTEDAWNAADRGAQIAEGVGDADRLGLCLLRQGTLLAQRGRLHEALAVLDRTQALFREIGHLDHCALALAARFEICLNAGETTLRSAAFQAWVGLARERGDVVGEARALIANGWALLEQDPRAAASDGERSLQLLRSKGSMGSKAPSATVATGPAVPLYQLPFARRLELESLDLLARAHLLRDEPDEGFARFREALVSVRREGVRAAEITVLKDIGHAQLYLDDPDAAIATYSEALDIARTIGARDEEADLVGELGNVHLFLDDLRPALARYRQALAIDIECGFETDEIPVRANIGDVLLRLGDLESAQQQLDLAFALAQRHGAREAEGWIRGLLGVAAFARGDAELAERQIGTARQILKAHAPELLDALAARLGPPD